MSGLPVFEVLFERALLSKDDVVFKPHARARRYVARIDKQGNIVLTVPNGGSKRDALAFANRHRTWLKTEQARTRSALSEAATLQGLKAGDSILYRGERVRLSVRKDWGRPVLVFGDQRLYIADASMDLARPLAAHLKALAKEELPARVFTLARKFGVKISKVVVRDQKTRWGSCSNSGTISLNWRLLLAPNAARDYVIIHELMHVKRFDHSAAFWRLVEKACPGFREQELWLNQHQDELNW